MPILVFLDLSVLHLSLMYTRDRRQTASSPNAPAIRGGSIIMQLNYLKQPTSINRVKLRKVSITITKYIQIAAESKVTTITKILYNTIQQHFYHFDFGPFAWCLMVLSAQTGYIVPLITGKADAVQSSR